MKADRGQSSLVTQTVARVTRRRSPPQNYGSGWFVYATAPWVQGRGVEHDGSNNLNYPYPGSLDAGCCGHGNTNSHDPNIQPFQRCDGIADTKLWAYYSRTHTTFAQYYFSGAHPRGGWAPCRYRFHVED